MNEGETFVVTFVGYSEMWIHETAHLLAMTDRQSLVESEQQ